MTKSGEIAMKLSYETRVLQKQSQRSKFIALSGGYHGETVFTLSAACLVAAEIKPIWTKSFCLIISLILRTFCSLRP